MTPTLIVSRIIAASPERVFAAWTDPTRLIKWWDPQGVACTGAKVEGRQGGSSRIENRLPDGKVVVISGEVLVWSPPALLSYTWWVHPGHQSPSWTAPGKRQRRRDARVRIGAEPFRATNATISRNAPVLAAET